MDYRITLKEYLNLIKKSIEYGELNAELAGQENDIEIYDEIIKGIEELKRLIEEIESSYVLNVVVNNIQIKNFYKMELSRNEVIEDLIKLTKQNLKYEKEEIDKKLYMLENLF